MPGCSSPIRVWMSWQRWMWMRPAPGLSQNGTASARPSAAWPRRWTGGNSTPPSNVTPDAAHHPTTMPLIAAGKHVLCEKPLAESFALADEMASAAEKAGVVNMVKSQLPQCRGAAEGARADRGGEIGEVRHVEASYRQSWLVGKQWGRLAERAHVAVAAFGGAWLQGRAR